METCSDVEVHDFLLIIGTALIINFKNYFFWSYFEKTIINSWANGASSFGGEGFGFFYL